MNEKDYVIKKEETAVYAESFGDSSINLLLWFWIRYPGEPGFMVVRHDAISTVKTVLEDNDILIPFPIRTLDFNAKGGDKLNAMINQKEERGTSEANSTSTQTTSDKKAGNDSDQPG